MARAFSSVIDFFATCQAGDVFTFQHGDTTIGRSRVTLKAIRVTPVSAATPDGLRDVDYVKVETEYPATGMNISRAYQSVVTSGCRAYNASSRGNTSLPGIGEQRTRIGHPTPMPRYSAKTMQETHARAVAKTLGRYAATVEATDLS